VAARATKLGALGVTVAAALALALHGGAAASPAGPAGAPGGPGRIVSIVPSVTEMLFAIGAGPSVVGVGSFDREPPEVARLPRVGGLLDPDIERVLSLRPDLVVAYGSQTDVCAQIEAARIPLFVYVHGGLRDILVTLRTLGRRVGRAAQADALAAAMERDLGTIRARVSERPHPRTLLVLERQPRTLRNMYVSGGFGFLNDMLDLAGGTNVFAAIPRESLQVSTETILALEPEVIVEFRYSGGIRPQDVEAERASWQALPALPAVRNGRVYELIGDEFVVPGPRVAGATLKLARALHPDAF
jgi:iron complex transport system substrate-binding protein